MMRERVTFYVKESKLSTNLFPDIKSGDGIRTVQRLPRAFRSRLPPTPTAPRPYLTFAVVPVVVLGFLRGLRV